MRIITGEQVRAVRVGLEMEPSQFAQVLQMHSSTLYRWESSADQPVRMEPFQLQLFSLMEAELQQRRGAELGRVLVAALVVGGGLWALHSLLEQTLPQRKPAKRPRSVKRSTSSAKRTTRPKRRKT